MLFKIDIWICLLSFPTLGTWIEISIPATGRTPSNGRSLHWERGLKCFCPVPLSLDNRRSLHWERGLK